MTTDAAVCAVCGQGGYWVGVVPRLGETRCLNHLDDDAARCDRCGAVMHRDASGFYVGDDDTSDCPADPAGHAVAGAIR